MLIVIVLALFVGACQSVTNQVQTKGGEAQFRRGIVALHNKQLVLQPCYSRKQEIVLDHTGKLTSYLNNQFSPSVYTEVSGREGQEESWHIHKVHILGGNLSTCYFELQGNLFRAAGDKPVWIADIRADGIYVQNDKGLTQLTFPAVAPLLAKDTLSWESELQGPNPQRLHLRLKQASCRDTHGIEYEYSARMQLNDQVLKGCARQGDLGRRTLPGIYQVKVAANDQHQQHITLQLESDGQVSITQDYRNQQPTYQQQGTWELLPSNKVAVYLSADQQDANDVLLFDRPRLGGLVMQGYSAVYGKAGLRFQRIEPEPENLNGDENAPEKKAFAKALE